MDKKLIDHHCIILAAGSGKRMKGFSDSIPKSLFEINNKTLLENHLDNLLDYQISDVTIVVGFEKDKIIDKIGWNYVGVPISYIESREYDSTNHSWSLFLTKNNIIKQNKPVLITHADTYYDPKLLTMLIQSPYKDLILVDSNFSIKTNDELMVSGNNNIVSDLRYIYEKIPEILGEFVGLHKFSFDFTVSFFRYLENYFKTNGRNDGYDWLIGKFINQTDNILHYQTFNDFKWINVNNPSDYYFAKKICKIIN